MECLCYTRRKSKSKTDYSIEEIKKRNSLLETVSSPGTNEICCSYILCEKRGIKPLKKQAVLKNNVYYFCSDTCWEEWVKNHELTKFAESPLLASSPEYTKYYYKNMKIDQIPPLFI